MLNKVELMGYLVRNLELKRTQTGKAVTNFTLACNRDYKAEGQDRGCDFIDCVAFGAAAEFASKYFSKGSMMAIVGRLTCRDWTDRDGNKRKATEVVAENIYFCSNGNSGDSAERPRRQSRRREEPEDSGQSTWTATPPEDGDLPF